MSNASATLYRTYLLGDCGGFGDAAVFAGAGRFRGCIADVGRHAQPSLAVSSVLKPDITPRLGHDEAEWGQNEKLRSVEEQLEEGDVEESELM